MTHNSGVMPKLAADDVTSKLALPWILRLRYGLVATQAAILALAVGVVRAQVPFWPAAAIVCLTVLSNALAARVQGWLRISVDTLIAALFCLDILSLTAIFILTGGATNPFSLLYLVQITLSATILSKRWTWFLGVLSVLCFAALFRWYRPIPLLEGHHIQSGRDLHLLGMWIGFAVAAFLIALFSGKISEALREREGQLLSLQRQLAAKEKLASLATLAAGAAHELSTPLATIAVVAKELEHFATRVELNEAVAEDSRLIRSEVERCRYILHGMSAQGASFPGEAAARISTEALVSRLREQLPAAVAERLCTVNGSERREMLIPVQALVQALSALVKNAAEAGEGKIALHIEVEPGDRVKFSVIDQGLGMPEEVLQRVGEPFFTTKPAGRGMGLGTFLVRAFAEQLGGSLQFTSRLGGGTKAALELPANSLEKVRVAAGNR